MVQFRVLEYTIGLTQAVTSLRYRVRLDLLMGNYKYKVQHILKTGTLNKEGPKWCLGVTFWKIDLWSGPMVCYMI